MKGSENINEIGAALAKAQSAFKDAAKDQQGYGYKYANLASILQIVRPAMTANGIAILQDVADSDGKVAVTTRLVHSSGQWLESSAFSMSIEPKKGLSHAQCMGSVVTYARRYALAALLGITQEDDDGTSAAEAKPAKRNTINENQAETIRVLCEQAAFPEKAIAKAYKVDAITEIDASRLPQILARLEERITKEQGEAA
jgi:hypothetical protein